MANSTFTPDDLNSLPILVLELSKEGGIVSRRGAAELLNVLGPLPIGANLAETVFRDDWQNLPMLQRDIISDLGKSIGDPALVGELLAAQLPTIITRNAESGLQTTQYQIIYGFPAISDSIKSILLHISPSSTSKMIQPDVDNDLRLRINSEGERVASELLLQLLRCNQDLLSIVEKEMNTNLSDMEGLLAAGKAAALDDYRRLFHAMKGATQQLGLNVFSGIALEAEHATKEAIRTGHFKDGESALRLRFEKLRSEWARIQRYRNCLRADTHSTKLNPHP